MTREVLCYATLGTYAFLRRETGTVVSVSNPRKRAGYKVLITLLGYVCLWSALKSLCW